VARIASAKSWDVFLPEWERLAETGEKRIIEALTRVMLHDEDSVLRLTAAAALGSAGDVGLAETLMQVMVNDSSADVRSQAAGALGRLIGERASPALARALRRDPDEHVRRHAADAMGEIGGRDAECALLHGLGEEHSVLVVRAITRSLATAGGGKAESVLIKKAHNCADHDFLTDIVEALGALGTATSVSTLVDVMEKWGEGQRVTELAGRALWAITQRTGAWVRAIRLGPSSGSIRDNGSRRPTCSD